MTITRTLTKYHAQACTLGVQDGAPVCNVIAEVDYFGTNDNVSAARAEFKRQGLPCPRGCSIIVTAGEQKTYACTLDDFLTVAQEV